MLVFAPLLVIKAVATPTGVPPRPYIQAGFDTFNIFWPFDSDANGTVYPCTYIPTLVLANHSRLIAHGSCALKKSDCNGLHLMSRSRGHLGGNPNSENLLCQKHSDDGGRTWSQIRVVSHASQNGQIVWDDVRKVLIAHWSVQQHCIIIYCTANW